MRALLAPLALAIVAVGCSSASRESSDVEASSADAATPDDTAASGADDAGPTADTSPAVDGVDDSPVALDLLSAQRLASGLEVLEVDPTLSAGCAAHVAYMKAAGKLVREESPDAPGYTPEGAAAAKGALLASNMPRASDAALAWIASAYHRVVWLEPGVQRVGFAYDAGYACFDVLSAWAPVERFTPVLYPGRDQVDVPTEFAPTVGLSPLPDDAEAPTGVVVSLLFPPEAELGVDLVGTLSRVDCDANCEVAATARLPMTVDDPYASWQRNAVLLIPASPLDAGTQYRVTVTGLVDAVDTTRTWDFQTAGVAPDAPGPATP